MLVWKKKQIFQVNIVIIIEKQIIVCTAELFSYVFTKKAEELYFS